MSVQGYVIPATLLRRGMGNVQKRTMYQVYPGAGRHAVVRDFVQFQEGAILRCSGNASIVVNGEVVVGSGKAGE